MRDRDTVHEIREHRTNGRYTGPVALAPSIEPTNDLAAAVLGARLVLVVVPSAAARAVIRVVREETAIRKLGVLSGPNIAPEILAGLPAATVVASGYPEVIGVAQGV